MNRAFLVGNLTRDPELRVTQSGIPVCSFTIACNRRFAKQGDAVTADFIPVVVWRGQAENCAKFLSKGRTVAVCGAIQTRSYDANDGSKRYVTEVVADEVQFIGGGSGEGRAARDAVPPPSAPPSFDEGDAFGGSGLQSIDEDNLPF